MFFYASPEVVCRVCKAVTFLEILLIVKSNIFRHQQLFQKIHSGRDMLAWDGTLSFYIHGNNFV